MADLLLRNARIWTGDSSQPWAEAAVVRDGSFAFVGRERDLMARAGVDVVDAEGHLILPGLIDGHAHLLSTGMAMSSVDLKDAATIDEAVRRVAERIAATPSGGWLRGAGWDQHLWPGGEFPNRRRLDAVAPDVPVALAHTSGHALWVNGAALRAAGIDGATASPAGGQIDLDAAGEPTGILRDAAAALIERAAPRPSRQERLAAVRDAVAHATRLGLTGVHAMDVGRGELAALQTLAEADELPLRVRAYLSAARLDD